MEESAYPANEKEVIETLNPQGKVFASLLTLREMIEKHPETMSSYQPILEQEKPLLRALAPPNETKPVRTFKAMNNGGFKSDNDRTTPDLASYACESHPDSDTGEPIFICTATLEDGSVSRAVLYGQPLVCTSEDQQRNNVIEATGIFSRYTPSGNVCRVLPPTMQEKLLTSAKSGAAHGFFRGGTQVLSGVLKSKYNVKEETANHVGQAVYYGGIFATKLASRSQNITDFNSSLNAIYEAAAETGQVLIVNAGISVVSKLIASASHAAASRKWSWISKILDKCHSLVQYGVFAKNAAEAGIAQTAASLAAGTTAQVLVEQTGKRLF